MEKVSDNEILWAKVKSNAKIPTKSKENAGYDIYACFDDNFICIPTGYTKLIPTGLACALNEKYYLQLEERGSTGSKGLKVSAGIVDSGYRGEIFTALTNCSDKDIIISKLSREELGNLCVNKINCENKESWYISIEDDYWIFPYSEEYTVIYSYDKAICQGIVHILPELESKEISYRKLKNYKSERGDGKIGSSGK